MKYTVGPWDISIHADNDEIVIRSPKGIIANCSVDTNIWAISKDEIKANAKLIAAAPEMLEALKKLLLDDQDLEERELMIRRVIETAEEKISDQKLNT